MKHYFLISLSLLFAHGVIVTGQNTQNNNYSPKCSNRKKWAKKNKYKKNQITEKCQFQPKIAPQPNRRYYEETVNSDK